ncbi:MAG TPA: glycoside hydrolase domain-containing protein, partial [Pyrinomonadaceae bacterium]|nr:glycoside hydrolase domain-containing protein [Pyrinomonadaceae bacterium]
MKLDPKRTRLVTLAILLALTSLALFAVRPAASKQADNTQDTQQRDLTNAPLVKAARPVSEVDLNADGEQLKSARLVAADLGWVVTDTHLLITTTAGKHWKDITPAVSHAKTLSAFFINRQKGWVVLSIAGRDNLASLVVASTTNGGESWTMVEPLAASSDYKKYELSDKVQVQFIDSSHGWLMAKLATSSNFSLGLILESFDGGRSWQKLPDPPIGDSLRFSTDKLGWLAGGADGSKLFRTTDGGSSWSEVILKAPDNLGESLQTSADLPTFLTTDEAILPITFSSSDRTTVVFYSSKDGGESWHIKRLVESGGFISAGNKVATAIIAPDLFAVASLNELNVNLVFRGKPTKKAALDLKPGANILAVDFVDATSGWILENEGECTDFKTQCSQTTALFITHDGAITMTEITPHLASRVTSDVVKDKNDILAPDTASGTHTSHNHKGFDKCAVDTVGNMQTWWTNSPYFDANVYLGGVNRSCSQANLNSAWVSQVSAQGWGLIPTWVGPQATCTTCTTCSVMSSNSSTAQAQGISEANSAADAASALGLTQTIIYYDMERYNPTTSCQTAVRSFINGWVQQMHARGNLAGVYGSPQNAQDDWASISNVPDAVWIAKWDDSISVFGLTPLSDSLWVNNQRIHQYHGGHNETYGSVTFNIDNDYEDGPVAGSNGTQSQPNLVPYQISGWSDKIVVSTLTGTNTDSSSYRTNDTLYVDWAEANIGTAATVPTFYSDLYVDGVFRQTWQTNFSLAPGAAANVLDYSIGSLSAGQHTIKIIIDTTNTISESSESDNEYTKIIAVTSSNTGTWTQLSSSPPAAITNCLLLTDGRVMCQQAGGNRWYALTPTSSGSYVNGTWSTLASMQSGYSPLYFASAVLPDGRVIIEGGEYNCSSFPNCGSPVQLSQGAIYNPSANSWTAVSPPSGWSTIGDAMGIVLADGSYFLSDSQSTKTAKFNASSLTWSAFGSGFQASTNNEAGWTLLPDNSLLTVDAHPANSRLSERFNAVTGVWSGAGNTPVSLADNDSTRAGASYEIGPGVLRPNGTVFYVGANPNIGTPCCTGSAHTAIFNTASNSWSAGPNIPNSDAANDAPAAVLPNSNVLMQLSPPFSDTVFGSPSRFYEFDGLTIFQVNSPALTNYSSFQGGMLVLPTGQVLFTHQTTDAYIYTSNGSPSASWAPTITNVSSTLSPGSTYTISGTQFNGLTQGAYYGDDLQAATNYPLVRITNNATGHIFYARTHGHSSMGVATGSSSVSTSFDVPAGIELGASMLVVVANGIPSASVNVNISNTALQVTVQTSPSGRTFTVDGTNYSSAQTFSWSSGSSHTIGTTSTQSGATGTQYTWSNWSDGGAISHSASPSSNTTYTANFTTQYFLTMNAGAGGSVSPSSNWFNSGQSVSISASPNSGFSFNGWTGSGSGSFTGSSNPASATMNGPITETATFASANVQVTVQTSPSGLAYTVDGNTFTGAQPFTWTSGSSHTISTTTPQSVIAGTQYLWSNWSDGGGISHSVSPTSNTTYTANFAQQHFLTMNASAGGTASPPSGWFNSGQTVSISANPNSGFGFDGWTGSGLGSFTGSTNPSSVAINGPVTETANFSLTPVGTNFAKAVNGGVASASSTTPNSQFPGYNFLPSVTVDGDRRGGLNFWRDDTASVYPDWLQVDFNGSKSITEVDVFTVQDNDQNTMEPTQAMTFSLNGITAFDVQYWTGSAWITVPNGSVTGNNKVWRQFTFSPIATSKIRVLVNNALNTRSRIVELEAWGTSSNGTNQALAANGGVASASSTTPNSQFPGYNFLPAVTI